MLDDHFERVNNSYKILFRKVKIHNVNFFLDFSFFLVPGVH
jgi:hypothetical protein